MAECRKEEDNGKMQPFQTREGRCPKAIRLLADRERKEELDAPSGGLRGLARKGMNAATTLELKSSGPVQLSTLQAGYTQFCNFC